PPSSTGSPRGVLRGGRLRQAAAVLSSKGGPSEYADRQGRERQREERDHREAEKRLTRRAAHAPDVVQARAAVAEQAKAHQGQRVGQRQDLGERGQGSGQGADREQRAGEEPGQDRDRRGRANVLLLLR